MLGYRVKEKREEKGLTQEELSMRSGISRQTISAIESNTNYSAGVGTLAAIAKALETTVDELFYTDGV